MKEWYSAQELSGLPWMPGDESNVRKMAKKNLWQSRNKLRGKGLEYHLSCLPQETQNALLLRSFDATAPASPAAADADPPAAPTKPEPAATEPAAEAPRSPSPTARQDVSRAALPTATAGADEHLTAAQRQVQVARSRLLGYIDEFKGGVQAAIDDLNAKRLVDSLPGPLRWAFEHAWDKPRAGSRLNKSTVDKWATAKKRRGSLAPRRRLAETDVKPWYGLAVALKQRPQKPTLAWIVEEIGRAWNPAWGKDVPSYHTVARFFREKFSKIDQLKGQHSGSALRAHRHYIGRTAAGMEPWGEIHADGWNTHFTAPHPHTGEFVTHEIWHAHDVATRYVPPFSVGLTENLEVIMKCFELTLREGGVPIFVQTDSTKIVRCSKKFKNDPATAISDRAGFTIVHPQTVGNSQANGIAENFNTYLDRCARELATYQAKGMDSLSLRRVKKLTEKSVKAADAGDLEGRDKALEEAQKAGKGRVFRSHAEMLDWLEDKRRRFNATPHSALPKIRDPETGRLRFQSPNEAIAAARAGGWEPVTLSDAELIDLFRPHVLCKVVREAVQPYGKMRFHHTDLGHYNGEELVVAYDIMDWRQVWVKNRQGDLICVAEHSAKSPYRTQTAIDAGLEKRTIATLKRLEKKQAAVLARVPGVVIEAPAEREKTIADLIDLDAIRVPAAPELSLIDLLPAPGSAPPEPRDLSYAETCLWLSRSGEKTNEGGDDTPEEAAAG